MTSEATNVRRGAERLLPAALPVAAAIGVFGIIYGAAASPVLGPSLTIASSVITFSGAAQFALVALLAAGAAPAGALGAVGMLALRHIPLAAVVRSRLSSGRRTRAALSWFLIDETTGLALSRPDPPERTMAITGALAYGAWVAGTIAGVTGGSAAAGSVGAIEPLAAAVFPVLFIGLAALTASARSDAARAVIAGGASVGLLVIWPEAGALGAIAVAIVVASVVSRR